MEELTREEFNSWKEQKVTKIVAKALGELQEGLKEHLSAGGTLTDENSSNKTAFVVGRIQGLSDFLKVEFDDAPEAKKDDYDH